MSLACVCVFGLGRATCLRCANFLHLSPPPSPPIRRPSPLRHLPPTPSTRRRLLLPRPTPPTPLTRPPFPLRPPSSPLLHCSRTLPPPPPHQRCATTPQALPARRRDSDALKGRRRGSGGGLVDASFASLCKYVSRPFFLCISTFFFAFLSFEGKWCYTGGYVEVGWAGGGGVGVFWAIECPNEICGGRGSVGSLG